MHIGDYLTFGTTLALTPGMKEISSSRAAFQSALNTTYSGRSGRRKLGDIAAARMEAAPVKSFETTLERSKTVANSGVVSLNGTSSGRSNAAIHSAINANFSPVRQNTVATSAGRSLTAPSRSTTSVVTTPEVSAAERPKFNAMQQNWLDANSGIYAGLMRANLSRSKPFQMEAVEARWANFSTGKPEMSSRAVGNVTSEGGMELASLLGGTLVQSPFGTFGTQQRDQYIRMPNGQMVEASVLASQLNSARESADPFSATQSVIEIYQLQNANYNLSASNDAIDLVTKGTLIPNIPNRTT